MRKDVISSVDDAVAISAVFGLIELCQREEAIRVFGRRLIGQVPKKLLAAVDFPIVVPI
jgi:hypothetical protein